MKISLNLTWGRVFTLVAFGLLFWIVVQQQNQLFQQQNQLAAFNGYLVQTQEVTERDFATKEELKAALQRQAMVNMMLSEMLKEYQQQEHKVEPKPRTQIIIPRQESPDEKRTRYLREILEGRSRHEV